MEHYFELSFGEWSYIAVVFIVMVFLVYLNFKDEKDHKKSIKPDETSAKVRYEQTEILESGIEVKPGRFYLADDPKLIVNDTILHIN